MPKSDSQVPASNNMEKLFLDILPEIPIVVRQACQNLNYRPDQMEFDGLVQRILLLLMDNDFHTLRSFANQSKPQTWLFTIARRYILRVLQKRKRELPLEELPPDALVVLSDVEETLLAKERQEILQLLESKLTERELELFGLLQKGQNIERIAEVMKIKRRSASAMKRALIKKLQNIISGKLAF